ncbi:MAG: aminoglycoside phosphotransferase family protein, partial [Gaiellaceae bacterium]
LDAPPVPGSNMKGDVAGANWWFLLPSLRAERIVCLGEPTPAALATLGRMSDDVTVCAAPRRGPTGLGGATADVVFLAGRSLRRLRPRRVRAEIHRLLRPDGLAYDEFTPVLDALRAVSSASPAGIGEVLWLAPTSGELRLAAPLGDPRAIAYLERRFLKHTVRRRRLLRKPRTFLGKHVLVNRLLPRRGAFAGRPETVAGAGPPRYLQRVAAESGLDLERHRWGLAAPGEFRSQKVLFFLFGADGSSVPDYVVKITRDPALNARLENERRALELIHEAGFPAASTLPRPVFFGYEHGLAVLGETAVDGVPFIERTAATPECPLARSAIEWLADLGIATARPPAGGAPAVAGRLAALFERFRSLYRLSRAHEAFLASQIASLADGETGLPVVFQHGDPGPWNLLVTASGEPAFLDWEAAEVEGMPLCDLFHFVRSYGVRVSRAAGTSDPMRSFDEQLLADSELGRLLARTTSRFCAEAGLATELVGPLFYVCWMQRALKEVTRLDPGGLDRGRYVNLLRVSIERCDAPGLRRLFMLPAGG